jgi:DNA-binding PadR family transcriptional regulator
LRVQEAVLNIVADGPGYGYQIARRLEGEWSSAAVYRALSRLLADGLIEPATTTASDSRRKPYRATKSGHKLNARRIANSLDSRHEMLSALLRAPAGSVVAALDELEARLLADIRAEPAKHPDLISELAWSERREVDGARLRWIGIARAKLGNDATLD